MTVTEKKKFFFDVNIFDEKEEPTEPPPPTFSESELADSYQKGFAEGKREGLKEAHESLERRIAEILEKIAKETGILFADESAREKTYERESVLLCLSIFQKIFPFYNATHGFGELKSHLETLLRSLEGQKQVVIRVNPTLADGVTKHLAAMKAANPDLHFSVQGEESMGEGACRLSWADGGAVRDAEAIAKQVEVSLRDLLGGTLAGNGAKGHDGTDAIDAKENGT